MTFVQRITPLLIEVAHKALDHQLFAFVEGLGNFLNALKSGQWERLPDDEQMFWLERVANLLGGRDGLSENFGFRDENVSRALEIVQAEKRAIERRTSVA